MTSFNQEKFLMYLESNKLHRTDRSEDSELYTYNHCDVESDRELRYSRSVIFDSVQRSVLSIGFPYTHELTDLDNNNSKVVELITGNAGNWVFTKSYEGTVLQMYYNDDEQFWNVSTMKKLNAHNSRWGSRESFGKQFDTIIEKYFTSTSEFYDQFDKSKTHTFLLPSTHSSRFVYIPREDVELIYTGSFDKSGNYSWNDCPVCFDSLRFVDYQNSDIESVFDTTKTIDITQYQGLFGYNTQTGLFVKIYNTNYLNAKLLRGNVQDLRKRYLETMRDDDLHRRFRSHFFDHQRLFRRLDGSVHSLVKDIINNNLHPENDSVFVNFTQSDPSFVSRNHKHVFNYIKNLDVNVLWNSVMSRMKTSTGVKVTENRVTENSVTENSVTENVDKIEGSVAVFCVY